MAQQGTLKTSSCFLAHTNIECSLNEVIATQRIPFYAKKIIHLAFKWKFRTPVLCVQVCHGKQNTEFT